MFLSAHRARCAVAHRQRASYKDSIDRRASLARMKGMGMRWPKEMNHMVKRNYVVKASYMARFHLSVKHMSFCASVR
jgi:hypothetical protein